MNRREFLKSAMAGLATSSFAPLAISSTKKAYRPNILLIMADDMGFADLGCYGSIIDTPNLDELAANGIRFNHFYNAARCCPTRASLLTGLYPSQAGMGWMTADWGLPGYRGELNNQCVTIAEVLRAGGYHTFMTGKWHVAPYSQKKKYDWPLQRGFEKFYGTIIGAGSYFTPGSLTLGNEPIEPEGNHYYYTDAISNYAVKFLNEWEQKSGPFFLYVAYTAPHWPLHALEEDIEKYKGSFSKGWDVLREEYYQRQLQMGIVDRRWKLSPRDENSPAWDTAEHKAWQQRRMEVYAAQIERMDRGIGKILSKVKELGVEEDTLVLFLSDNGGCAVDFTKGWNPLVFPSKTHDGKPVRIGRNPDVMPGPEDTYQAYGLPWANLSDTPFRKFKSWTHEGGIATPLIAHWPQVIRQKGVITNQVGHIIDIMTTCVDVSGVPYPMYFKGNKIKPMEGKSLLPIFKGQERQGHKALFWEHQGCRAVRKGAWKLVSRRQGNHSGPWELYNIEQDRTELHNLVSRFPQKVQELNLLYQQWAERCNVLPWIGRRKPVQSR